MKDGRKKEGKNQGTKYKKWRKEGRKDEGDALNGFKECGVCNKCIKDSGLPLRILCSLQSHRLGSTHALREA